MSESEAPFPGEKLDNRDLCKLEKIVQGLGTRKKEVGVVRMDSEQKTNAGRGGVGAKRSAVLAGC